MTAQEPNPTADADTEKVAVPPAGAVRCSDVERERASSVLHVAAGEGRLTLAEVEDRLTKIYSARFRYELDAITADLPSANEAATGWRLILAMTRHQLAEEVSALTGHGQTALSRRRRLALALAMLGMLMLVATTMMLALHGITGDGIEHHDLGRG
ncbi:MAG: hypothetical protein QOI21_4188 [Actinomycetota bacterium]|jgi:hypothetical protein|nr:hypothetical protein [Actinomycetota bacterium]